MSKDATPSRDIIVAEDGYTSFRIESANGIGMGRVGRYFVQPYQGIWTEVDRETYLAVLQTEQMARIARALEAIAEGKLR